VHGDVVAGNDRLGREVRDLLFQRHLFRHAHDEGNLEVDAHVPDGVERAQQFHHAGAALLDDADVPGNQRQRKEQGKQYGVTAGEIRIRHDKTSSVSF